MNADDRKEFFTLIAMTAEAYGTTDLTKTRLALMFDDLSEYDIGDIAKALREHRKSCKWFPKVSEIVERMQPNTDQTALIAWSQALPLLRDSRNAKSDDPITEKVIQDLGGWFQLGMKSTSELVWVEKEFEKRYAMYAEHGTTDTAKLLGHRNGLRLVGRD
jgi:hypothetical protein